MLAQFPTGFGGKCLLNGMTFTPDGQRLRVASESSSEILEFDGDGNWSVVLNSLDGIDNPLGGNSIAYDRSGNFFVFNDGKAINPKIMKFPGGKPPGSLFAGPSQGVRAGPSPIAAAPDGNLYYNPSTYGPLLIPGAILRYAPDGSVSLFDIFEGQGITSLAVDAENNLYVSTQSIGPSAGIWRYENGNPTTKQQVSSELLAGAIALSPDGGTLYSNGGIVAIDLNTGAKKLLGTYPPVTGSPGWGAGLALYVPEPSSLLCLTMMWLVLLRRR
jgi:sugar lactone lactonase YvrE